MKRTLTGMQGTSAGMQGTSTGMQGTSTGMKGTLQYLQIVCRETYLQYTVECREHYGEKNGPSRWAELPES